MSHTIAITFSKDADDYKEGSTHVLQRHIARRYIRQGVASSEVKKPAVKKPVRKKKTIERAVHNKDIEQAVEG